MQGTILTIGEILVEIMATTPGHGFREPIELIGPYPSGGPAIFIDEVAKQGHRAAIVSAVGDDDFGRLNTERLARDGVDIAAIAVHPDAPTGSAFVRYRPDGSRDFVFNIRHSASGHVALTPAARAAIDAAAHLHVVGSSLSTPAIIEAVTAAIDTIKHRGGTVSFDPNIRKEMLGAPTLRETLAYVLKHTDLFLPSGPELLLFTDETDETEALRDIVNNGVGAVVLKQGAAGARYLDLNSDITIPAFTVTEIDPTGAGDIFGATFVTGWLNALEPTDNLRRANAAGALAVTRKGPMEGTSTPAEIDAFLAAHAT